MNYLRVENVGGLALSVTIVREGYLDIPLTSDRVGWVVNVVLLAQALELPIRIDELPEYVLSILLYEARHYGVEVQDADPT